MIYAIGDIHGQITMLHSLLDKLRDEAGLNDDDTLIFLGDYIDRGENSRDVIDTLITLHADHPNSLFLRGNHEQLMLDSRAGAPPEKHANGYVFNDIMEMWLTNGGVETLTSYRLKDVACWWESIPDAHWTFLQKTLMEHREMHYHFVHAGLLPPTETWEGDAMGMDYRLWIREPFLHSRHDFGSIVVFGHTPWPWGMPTLWKPLRRVLQNHKKLALDTGAVYKGMLTAVGLQAEFPGKKAPDPIWYHVPYAVTPEL